MPSLAGEARCKVGGPEEARRLRVRSCRNLQPQIDPPDGPTQCITQTVYPNQSRFWRESDTCTASLILIRMILKQAVIR